MEFQKDYAIIFSVDGLRTIDSDYRASEYSLTVGESYRFMFRNGHLCRVEDVFISHKCKVVFIALTEIEV